MPPNLCIRYHDLLSPIRPAPFGAVLLGPYGAPQDEVCCGSFSAVDGRPRHARGDRARPLGYGMAEIAHSLGGSVALTRGRISAEQSNFSSSSDRLRTQLAARNQGDWRTVGWVACST